MYKMMQQDLERCFGFKASVGKGIYKRIQLLSRPGPDLLFSKGGKPFLDIRYQQVNDDTILHLSLKNQPFDSLTRIIRENLSNRPIVFEDLSFYRSLGNIDIEIRWYINNDKFIKSLLEALKPFNLTLVSTDTWTDILTITDKK
jgi:hypothetical protein